MDDEPIEKWQTRELLGLAYAVSWSEDKEDWRTISRKVKYICEEQGRPISWYTVENCKRQYLHLLKTEAEVEEKPTVEQVLKRLNDKHNREIIERIRQIDIDDANMTEPPVDGEPY